MLGYRPRNRGGRFAARALLPSAASSLAQHASKCLTSSALSGWFSAFLA